MKHCPAKKGKLVKIMSKDYTLDEIPHSHIDLNSEDEYLVSSV